MLTEEVDYAKSGVNPDGGGRPRVDYIITLDAALALGYSTPQKAVRDHCKNQITVPFRNGMRGNPLKTLIPEADLYRLVMRSKLPSAERFQDWVVEDVLLQIRRTGGYTRSLNNSSHEHLFAQTHDPPQHHHR